MGDRNVLARNKRIVSGPKGYEDSGTSEMVQENTIRFVRDEIRERADGRFLDSSIKFFIYRGL